MSFKIIDVQKDDNLDCFSVLTTVELGFFVEYIRSIHEQGGNIEEQREVLSTRSALIIRNQMVNDLEKGGLLPPIVLGVLTEYHEGRFEDTVKNTMNISILDGMQRIEAIKKSFTNKPEIGEHILRVEFWFTKTDTNLLYRMLILNSGQIPWGLNKQLEVVFKPILRKLNIDSTYLKEYEIVELFLAFSSRKVKIDKKQQLAEYYSALDVMDLLRKSGENLIERFGEILKLWLDFEKSFSLSKENNLAFSQTAKVGFMVACSEYIYGVLGNGDRSNQDQKHNFNSVVSVINNLKENKDVKFLALDILNEELRYILKENQRKSFLNAFKSLFREDKIDSLAVCWLKMDY